jgi:hypothetical protein
VYSNSREINHGQPRGVYPLAFIRRLCRCEGPGNGGRNILPIFVPATSEEDDHDQQTERKVSKVTLTVGGKNLTIK